MSKAYRLGRIQQHYDRALANPDNKPIQRDCLSAVFREAYQEGLTIQELAEFFQSQVIARSTEEKESTDVSFECPSCQRSFRSQAALSAHGPMKCANKKKGGRHGA